MIQTGAGGEGTIRGEFCWRRIGGRGRIRFLILVKPLRCPATGLKPLGYEVIKFGGDRPIALHEIITQIGGLTGREQVIEYRDAHPADVPGTWANVEKARKLLGWKSEVRVEEGLRRCVEWYWENRGIGDEDRTR